MARVEFARRGERNLETLIHTHSLPEGTRARVIRSARGLARFPRMGAPLEGRWDGFRFLLGPWRWMILVYVHLEDQGRVVVVTIQDARSSTAATGEARCR